MSNDKSKIPWFGVALIVIGVAILLRKLNILDIEFSNVFWPLMIMLAIVTVTKGFSHSRRGQIFGGTVWFLYSLFFLLRSSDFIEVRPHMFFPATFLVFGIAFLMLYVNNFRDWYFLIPALILGGTGSMFIFAEYGYLYYWDIWYVVHTYWPAVLILFGLGIILKRRPQQPSNQAPA